MNRIKVIGLVGTFAAGKEVTKQIIAEITGAPSSSLANKIREEASRRGLDLVRENLVKVANEMRAKDPGYWAKKVIEDAEHSKAKLFVAEPFRSLTDLRPFKEKYGKDFILIAIDAPIKLRYERAVARAREGEWSISFEDFKAGEQKESRPDAAEHEQNIPRLMSMADFKILNDSSMHDLKHKVKEILKKIDVS